MAVRNHGKTRKTAECDVQHVRSMQSVLEHQNCIMVGALNLGPNVAGIGMLHRKEDF